MSEFSIKIAAIGSEVTLLEEYAKAIKDEVSKVESIKGRISLGSSTADVRRALANCMAEMCIEEDNLKILGSQLKCIIDEYKKAESQLVNPETSKSDATVSNGQADADKAVEGKNSEQDTDNSSNEEDMEIVKEILLFVLGFVPGVNCVIDIISLVDHWQTAWADEEISFDEALVLALDVVALVGDVVQFGTLVKSLAKSSKKVKLAKTAAKKATKKAANAADKAEKAAAKASGKKAAQKAQKAATKADKLAAKADKAAEAAETAKNQFIKETKEKVLEETAGNVADYTNNMEVNIAKDAYEESVMAD